MLVAPLESSITFGVLDLHMRRWPGLVSMHIIMLLCTSNNYPGDSTAVVQPQVWVQIVLLLNSLPDDNVS